jgi:hypothetical protein
MAEDNSQDTSGSPDNAAVEKEARQFGWSPKEEFKGDESQWRSAEEFLQRGREINGFLRKDLDKIRTQNLGLESELRTVREAVVKFKEFHEQTEERAYKKALADLQSQKKKAITEGDGDTVVAIEEAMDQLKEERNTTTPAAATSNPSDEVYRQQFIAWSGENQWFQTDTSLRAAANGFADIVKAENPSLVGTPFLEAVANKVKEAFPDKFENGLRGKPSAVEGNTNTPRSSSSKKSYADLPPEAKAACDSFVEQGLLTKEQYIKDFFEG